LLSKQELKKAVEDGGGFTCQAHGKVVAEKRAVSNIVIDDGTENMRAVLFSNVLNDIGISDFENTEKMLEQKQGLLGKEMVFSGNVRNNNYFNNLEFIVDSINEVNLDELVASLEK